MICRGMDFIPQDSMFQHLQDSHVLSSPQDFHGVSALMMRRSMSFSGVDDTRGGGDDDMSDDGCPLGEKKRRLNMEQVKALEKSFELGNKLEPERKIQLARALGLQPRQIAIWFQNRRARWKTKQLEKDYDILKRKFEAIKADNDALKSLNHKLHSELLGLKNRECNGGGGLINLNKDNEGSWSNGSENSIDVNLGGTGTASADSPPPPPSYPNPINKNGFPSSIAATTTTTTSLTQLLQSSARLDHLQCNNKVDQNVHQDNEGGFCNMFNAIEEQPNFWPWPEQQHFH